MYGLELMLSVAVEFIYTIHNSVTWYFSAFIIMDRRIVGTGGTINETLCFRYFLYYTFTLICMYTITTTLHTKSGCGKREAHINGPWGPAKTAPVTGTTLITTGPVPADSWQ